MVIGKFAIMNLSDFVTQPGDMDPAFLTYLTYEAPSPNLETLVLHTICPGYCNLYDGQRIKWFGRALTEPSCW